MKKNFAYTTYKNVEAAENFTTPRSRAAYQKLLMDRVHKKEILFFKKIFPKGLGQTLEVGSGNSRILYALEKEGLLISGLGIEISPSRVAFANAWKKDLRSTKITTIVGDILTTPVPHMFDTILCLTSIFPFFDMLQKNGLATFLKKAHHMLKPGGTLILESVTFRDEIACCNTYNGSVNLWAEFKKDDPFQFNLVAYTWDAKKRTLAATSYNTKRHEHLIDGPTVKKWHMETPEEISRKLVDAGFSTPRTCSGYTSTPLKKDSFEYLFVAKKQK